MARSIRSKLENRSSRFTNCKRRRKPYYERIGTGCWLGYRRTKTNGTWVLRVLKGGSEWTRAFAQADDFQESDGKSVLNYFEAQRKAQDLAGAGKDGTSTAGQRPVSVAQAVDDYEAHLTKHGRDTKNAKRVRSHLRHAHGLANICVASLVAADFKAWDKSFAGLAPASINRVNNSLKAALNRAQEHDKKRITNADEWTIALERLGGADANRSRNVILLQPTINAIIAASYSLIGPEFGLLVEVAAQTGARYSQLVRLTVGNIKIPNGNFENGNVPNGNISGPHLMMPTSRKGWSRKKSKHRPVPITADLAHRLAKLNQNAGTGSVSREPPHAPLLMKTVDTPWTVRDRDHFGMFKQVVEHLKDDPGIKGARFPVTLYALRHSSIARQLLDNVGVKIVADLHDTSIEMIQKNYSEYLTDHSDSISRRTLSAFAGNVVSLPATRVG